MWVVTGMMNQWDNGWIEATVPLKHSPRLCCAEPTGYADESLSVIGMVKEFVSISQANAGEATRVPLAKEGHFFQREAPGVD